MGAEYCDEHVCLCVCVCVCVCPRHIFGTVCPILTKLFHMLPMTSYLLINQGARGHHPAEAHCTCSLGLGYKLCAVITVAGQRTHGSTFRTVRVTSQLATTGTESTVCDFLVFLVFVNISHGSVIRWRMRFVILMTDTWRIKRCVIRIVVDLSSY